ncbi:MAG: hypothetical protein AAFV43_12625 [Planctomycetota bacterium]
MSPFQRYAHLTSTHLDVLDTVEELDFAWGAPVETGRVAERLRLDALRVRRCVHDLAHVGLLEYDASIDASLTHRGLPLLGEVG